MKQKGLSVILRVISALCIIVLLSVIVGTILHGDSLYHVKDKTMYVIWQIITVICSLVCIAAIIIAWLMFADIGKDLSLTVKNSRRLLIISNLFLFDTVVFSIFFISSLFTRKEFGVMFAVNIGIIFVGVSLTVICACLSHLVEKAAAIEKETKKYEET